MLQQNVKNNEEEIVKLKQVLRTIDESKGTLLKDLDKRIEQFVE